MRKFFAVFAAALICVAGAAHAKSGGLAAQQVLNQARAATGGAGWNMLRGFHETGLQGGVRYERWFDPLRYGARIETHEPAGLHVHGFNGAGDWQIMPNGAVTGVDDFPTVAQARTEAFFSANGFFYPSRYDVRSSYLGVRKAQGRAFDVVRIQIVGGRAREAWFDRRTHLLGRIVDRSGPRPVTVEVSDYRKVGPVLMAFRFTSDAEPARVVETVDFRPVDRGLFSLPRPTAPAR